MPFSPTRTNWGEKVPRKKSPPHRRKSWRRTKKSQLLPPHCSAAQNGGVRLLVRFSGSTFVVYPKKTSYIGITLLSRWCVSTNPFLCCGANCRTNGIGFSTKRTSTEANGQYRCQLCSLGRGFWLGCWSLAPCFFLCFLPHQRNQWR